MDDPWTSQHHWSSSSTHGDIDIGIGGPLVVINPIPTSSETTGTGGVFGQTNFEDNFNIISSLPSTKSDNKEGRFVKLPDSEDYLAGLGKSNNYHII